MTPTLVLIRHATAAAGNGSDIARPLTAGGWAEARRLGRFLAAQGLVPELLYRSPARRARETATALCEAATPAPRVIEVGDLYMAGGSDIRDLVFAAATDRSGAPSIVAVVAHNPGIQVCAVLGAGAEDAARLARFPPASAAVIAFDGDGWAAMRGRTGRLAVFATPADYD